MAADPSDVEALRELLIRFQNGADGAAAEMFGFFNDHVMRVVRRRLSRSIRPRLDTEDLAQSVWATVWKNRERLQGLDDTDAAMAFIVTIAKRKAAYALRKHVGSKRRTTRAEAPGGEEKISDVHDIRQSSPSQELHAKEVMHQLKDGETSRCHDIIDQRMAGMTIEQIAEELNVNEKTVRRALERLSKKVKK